MKRIMWILILATLIAGPANADFNDEFNSPVLDLGWGFAWGQACTFGTFINKTIKNQGPGDGISSISLSLNLAVFYV